MPEEQDADLQDLLQSAQRARGVSIPAVGPSPNPFAAQAPPVFSKGDKSELQLPHEFTDAYRQAEFLRENAQPGVPLDIETGAPWTQRFMASFRRDPEQVVRYWQGKYGDENVRLTKTGDLIVRTQDEKTKKPKDILVDEPNFTMKDFADMAGSMPEVAATIASIWAAKRLPTPVGQSISKAKGLGGLVRDIVAGTSGTFLGGVTKDELARAADALQGHRIEESLGQLPKVMGERAEEIPGNFVGDVAGFGLGKIAGKVISPFYKVNPLQEDAREATKWVKENLGIDYPMTAGEKTGSQLLQRLEAFQERLPGTTGKFKEIKEEQRAALNQIQNVLQGVPQQATAAQREATVPTMDTLLRRLRHAVQKDLEPLEERVANARENLVTKANQGILNEISAATLPQRELDRGVVGEAIRSKVEAIRKDFQTTSANLYDAVRQLPGGSDRILSTPNLSKKAADYLKKEVAGADITTTVPTGLLGPTGAPLTTTTTTSTTAEKFIPEDILGRLKQLAQLGTGKFSLQDLIAMRNDVSNAIAVGESIPGVKTHHLREISKMLTEGMDDAVNSIPNPQLKLAWRRANQFYKDNVEKFHTRLISSILKPTEAQGYLGNREIVERLIRGEDKFEELKKFLGPNSPEFQMLKGHIADYMFAEHSNVGKTTLNAKDFLTAMNSFELKNPKLFKEVFGQRAANIFSLAQQAAVGQADKLDAALIEQGIRNPARFPNILELVKAQRAIDKAYKNDILKSVGSKSFPGAGFNANDFVNRFVRSSSAAEIKPVMDAITDEGLKWQVRAKTVEDLLNEVARHPTGADRAARALDPRYNINSVKLQEILGDNERYRVLETILGKDKLDLLERMGKLVRVGEARQQSFQTAASLSAGAQISALERGGIIHFIGGALENALASTLLTAPMIRQWVGNTVMTPARQYKVTLFMLGSEPFTRSLVEDLGPKGAVDAVKQAKQRGDQWLQMHYTHPQADQLPGTNDARALKVLQQLAQ